MTDSYGLSPLILALALVPACHESRGTVDIHGKDYAFNAPATVTPGVTTFRFINEGTVLHEVQLFRFHPGITADSAAILLAAGPLPQSAYDVSGSVLITAPGTTAHEQVVVTLAKGDVYGLLCEFRNADSLPRHAVLGMWKVLKVE